MRCRRRPGRESSRSGTTVEYPSYPHARGQEARGARFRFAASTEKTDEEPIKMPTKDKNKLHSQEKALRESQIKDLVAYIRELGHKK